MRTCSTCGETKQAEAFGVEPRVADRCSSQCRICERERLRAWSAANREQEKLRGRAYTAAHPERRVTARRKHKLKQYGLTIEGFEQILAEQDGRCAVCGFRPPAGKNLHIDHCHTTGRVRGLLCGNCNRALGILNEDPERITALAEYATRHARGGDAA